MFHDCKLLPRVAPTDEARVSQTTNTVQLEEAAEEQTMLVKKEMITKAKRQYQQKKKQIEDLTFTVIGKEIQMEDMVKKEEQQKEQVEEQKIQAQIQEEEKKAECLEKAFEEKELDDEFVESNKEFTTDLNDAKQQAAKKINQGRLQLKKSLAKMQLKAKKKKEDLATKLTQIRSQISKQIMIANKKGDMNSCESIKKETTETNHSKRDDYCNNNFTDDWARNTDCKTDEFCYICCENEFGAMYVVERDNCYNMCDDVKPPAPVPVPTYTPTPTDVRNAVLLQPSDADPNAGKWVWAPRIKPEAITQ